MELVTMYFCGGSLSEADGGGLTRTGGVAT